MDKYTDRYLDLDIEEKCRIERLRNTRNLLFWAAEELEELGEPGVNEVKHIGAEVQRKIDDLETQSYY